MNLMFYIIMVSVLFVIFQKVISFKKVEKSELCVLSNVQIRFKINMGKPVCIMDKVKKVYMLVYPLNTKEARIKISNSNVEGIHKCRISLLSEIMELVETRRVEVYDGEDFIASSKIR